jgi:hypothetical protein
LLFLRSREDCCSYRDRKIVVQWIVIHLKMGRLSLILKCERRPSPEERHQSRGKAPVQKEGFSTQGRLQCREKAEIQKEGHTSEGRPKFGRKARWQWEDSSPKSKLESRGKGSTPQGRLQSRGKTLVQRDSLSAEGKIRV